FNLVRWSSEANGRPTAQREADAQFGPVLHGRDVESAPVAGSEPEPALTPVSAPADPPSTSSGAAMDWTPQGDGRFDTAFLTRVLSSVWLAGCLFLGLKLLGTALVLRRRLSACRPVTDAAVLEVLESSCRRLRLRRTPALLVLPECFGPCIMG